MALARLDIPGLVFYNGSIAPGRFRGRDVTIQDVFEAIGAHAAGKMTDEDVHELEGVACPGAGACGGQFTANTMATVLDFLGISPRGLNGIPATAPGESRGRGARRGGWSMDLVRARHAAVADPHARRVRERDRRDRRHRRLDERRPPPARDRARGRASPFELDDFDTIAARTPIVADLKPGGRFVATDLHEAGGVGARRARAARRGLVHARRAERRRPHARRGRRGGRRSAGPGGRRPDRDADQADRRPRDPARLARARGLRRQARRPRAPAPPRPGARLRLRGGVLRGRQGAADRARRRGRDPLRGPRRRARDARDAARDRARSSARGSATRSR